ncbi:very-long-chain-acyl-CoA dehydrogenase [Aureococcus anophagefferens]|nr:very-long-chain-acyl-CoA dehydrogenase [Aureococcus anophagefferens]
MHERIYPNEVEFLKQCHAQGKGTSEWTHPPLIIDLMREAKAAGLWNLFLPADTAALVGGKYGGGLTNLQYADLCEIMGTSVHAEFAAQATNCTSPDTGNMETIARFFGSEEQKRRWLDPLLAGEIRSCFAMTEPDVASSDATNVSVDIRGDGDDYVVNGRKWWITGAGSLHCKVMILMGKTDVDAPPHAQQSMLLVPMDAPGIRLVRPLTVFGDDDAPQRPHGDVRARALAHVRESRAAASRSPRDGVLEDVARARDIDAARHLVREAAHLMDAKGNTDAHTPAPLHRQGVVPATLQRIADQAMQLHGAAGLCADTPLVHIFAAARILRIADGPDAVHWRKAGQMEFKQQRFSRLAPLGLYTPPRDANEPHFRYTTDAVSPAKQAELDAFEALMRE